MVGVYALIGGASFSLCCRAPTATHPRAASAVYCTALRAILPPTPCSRREAGVALPRVSLVHCCTYTRTSLYWIDDVSYIISSGVGDNAVRGKKPGGSRRRACSLCRGRQARCLLPPRIRIQLRTSYWGKGCEGSDRTVVGRVEWTISATRDGRTSRGRGHPASHRGSRPVCHPDRPRRRTGNRRARRMAHHRAGRQRISLPMPRHRKRRHMGNRSRMGSPPPMGRRPRPACRPVRHSRRDTDRANRTRPRHRTANPPSPVHRSHQ